MYAAFVSKYLDHRVFKKDGSPLCLVTLYEPSDRTSIQTFVDPSLIPIFDSFTPYCDVSGDLNISSGYKGIRLYITSIRKEV